MKVSVIVTTYNHEKFIAQALDSVLMQEVNFEYEIIIIEDCSTDSTRDIVIDFQKKYPNKIRLVLSEKNKNDNRSWAEAIQNAQSKYIALLDGDDYWTSPHKLQKQVSFLDSRPECAICFHSTRHFYEDGRREAYNSEPPNGKEIFTLEDLILGNFIPTCSVMIRQGLVGQHPDWFYDIYSADTATYILNAQYGYIGYINEVMGATRIHSGGAWNGISRIKQLEILISNYDTLKAGLEVMNNKITTSKISEFYFKLALEYEKQGDLTRARTCAIKSIFVCPFHQYTPTLKLLKLFMKLYAPILFNIIPTFKRR